jgi:hypothetical protein
MVISPVGMGQAAKFGTMIAMWPDRATMGLVLSDAL